MKNPIRIILPGTDENIKAVGKQMKNQLESYESNLDHSTYKFTINSDEWLFEGCWLQDVTYNSLDINPVFHNMEIDVRYDRVVEK